jgi:hypothetical protein
MNVPWSVSIGSHNMDLGSSIILHGSLSSLVALATDPLLFCDRKNASPIGAAHSACPERQAFPSA